MTTVERLPITLILGYFVGYLVTHILIGIFHKELERQLQESPDDSELKVKYKWTNVVFKWYPAAYVIFIVVTLSL